MDIQTRKLHIIEDITKINDPAIIAKVEELLSISYSVGQSNNAPAPYNVTDIKGLLTAEEAEKYHRHIDKTRDEWSRDI